MVSVLSDNVLLSLFLVIALGAAFGAIPFGPLRFGAAGALFIGLFAGIFIELDRPILLIFQDLGLGLFVYMIGLGAGEEFFRNLRKQFGIMAACVLTISLSAVVAVVGGTLLGIGREAAVGAFAGSMTSTPSLALAQEQTGGSGLPAVGYSIGYPVGVATAILLVAFTLGQKWKAAKDPDNSDARLLRTLRVVVTKSVEMSELQEKYGDQFVLASITRKGHQRIAGDYPSLQSGDIATFVVTKGAEKQLVKEIGHRSRSVSIRDRHVTIATMSVSSSDIAGRTVGSLPLFASFRARILRIRRGDEEILANDDTALEYGDLLEVVVPAARRDDVAQYLGDSVQSFSELDWIAVAGGLALGFIVALVNVPLPGGSSFALGAAAGPLLVGMVLGTVRRTGRTAWQIPRQANFTLRQLGLMLFLAAVGLANGKVFSENAFSTQGILTGTLAIIIPLVGCGGFLLVMRFMGQSPARANGAMSGILGQPAVLQYALENTTDNRVEAGYSATFAIALLYKIVIIPLMLSPM